MNRAWLDRALRAASLSVALLFALAIAAPAAHADKRVALVIGNAAYQNAPPLVTPVKDAKAMAELFRKAGFDAVNVVYDATHAQFVQAIRQFDDTAADSDMAVIYFAGHGLAANGANYLIPVDAKLASDWDLDDQVVALDRFVAAAVQAQRLALVIIDASADNALAKNMQKQRPNMRPGLSASVLAGSVNAAVAYAAKEGSSVVPGEGEHSPYTAALLEDLFVPGLDIRLAFGRVRDQVLRVTGNKEEPAFYGTVGGGVIALVPEGKEQPTLDPPRPAVDVSARTDYHLIEMVDTRGAWEAFLSLHPAGCYADLARAHVAALDGGKEPDKAAGACDK